MYSVLNKTYECNSYHLNFLYGTNDNFMLFQEIFFSNNQF